MKRKFQVTLEVTFDDDIDLLSDMEQEHFEEFTSEELKRSMQVGFGDNAAEELFGESFCMIGMETPQVTSVKELK